MRESGVDWFVCVCVLFSVCMDKKKELLSELDNLYEMV